MYIVKAAGVLSHRTWEVSLVLYPSTAEDSVSQFVRLTLTLTLDLQVRPRLCDTLISCTSSFPVQPAEILFEVMKDALVVVCYISCKFPVVGRIKAF